jgi:hypothetical protein
MKPPLVPCVPATWVQCRMSVSTARPLLLPDPPLPELAPEEEAPQLRMAVLLRPGE